MLSRNDETSSGKLRKVRYGAASSDTDEQLVGSACI